MIQIKDLSILSEGRLILSRFSLMAKGGSTVVISGPSGSGKSTILKAVMGFVLPAEGEILINGRRMNERSVWELRRNMAYVPQEIDMGDGTAREVLMRLFHYKASSSLRWNEARLRDLLEVFMLGGGLLGKDVREISGGEKQRLALVAALMLERPLLVLDEITTGLDPESKRTVLEHLKRREDITSIVATHDETFMGYADKIVHIGSRDKNDAVNEVDP